MAAHPPHPSNGFQVARQLAVRFRAREAIRGRHQQIVQAAGVAGGPEPEPSRRVAAEHVALEHPVLHQIAVARRGALLVERRAREAPWDVRPLLHGDEGREHLAARGLEQERGLAILAGAADRTDEVPDQATRHLGHERHRRLARRQPAGAESRQRAAARGAADSGDRLELRRVARHGVPVVALHVLTLLRDERSAHRVAGGGVAGEKAERVAVHTAVALAADCRALGVADTRIEREPRRLALARQLDGALRRELPGMIEIEIWDVAGKRLGLDETGVAVLGRVARDRARLADGLGDRRAAQVRGAGRALALAEVHRDSKAAVALVFDGVDCAEPDVHRQSAAHRGVGVALRGALAGGLDP